MTRNRKRVSRRTFLKRTTAVSLGLVGAGGVAAPTFRRRTRPLAAPPAAQHGQEPRGLRLPQKDRAAEGRFGLMFKQLPPFAPPDALLTALADRMRESAEAPLAQGDNPQLPAGFTFLGQFIDHDLTFDTTLLTDQQADPDAVRNFRSARYDLDSVYGLGPTQQPHLYDPRDPAKLLIAGLHDPHQPDDLPRQSNGTALIGDPRNDENLNICQLHLAFMKFHNVLVDHVRAQGVGADDVFEGARRLTRWHFQWVVIHDFLPRVVGRSLLDQLLVERGDQPAKVKLAFYKPKNPNKPMLPVEFAVAAYRFGHSLIRPSYRLNASVGAAAFEEPPTEQSLNGSRPLPPSMVIQWHHFFDIAGQAAAQRARRIDSQLSPRLFHLPSSLIPPPDPHVSLAERNLLRGKRLGLPSGQAVARAMGVPVLSNQELGLGQEAGWQGEAPLWYYLLKEAELQHQGVQLGAVGGRIVGEVLVGLLERDRNAYLNQDPRFRPVPPIAPAPGQFAMGDLLKFAGVA